MNNYTLNEAIEYAKISDLGTWEQQNDRFVINNRHYKFVVSVDDEDDILLEILYKGKLTSDLQHEVAEKLAKLNATTMLSGFSLNNNGQLKVTKTFSKHEDEENIARTLLLYLQNADSFVIL